MSSEDINNALKADSALKFTDNLNQEITAERLRDFINSLVDKTVKLLLANEIGFGSGVAGSDIIISFETGSVNPPKLKYNITSNKFEFSNDGTTFEEIGSGSGGIVLPLILDGISDVVQFIIEAHTTQNADIYQVKDSAGNVIESISNEAVKAFRGKGVTPSATADTFKIWGKDYDGNVGQISPYIMTEDGKVFNVRDGLSKPYTIDLNEFDNSFKLLNEGGSQIEIVDIIFDTKIFESFLFGAMLHGVGGYANPAYEPIITNPTTKASAISDMNAWLNGSGTIDGNAYASLTNNELSSFMFAGATFNTGYNDGQIMLIVKRK